MLLRSDSSDSSPRSLAPDEQDSERNLEDIMNTTRDKLQVMEKELNSTPTESIANLFLDLFDSGLGAEEAGHSDWFARSAELLDEFKSLHHKVQEVEERNQALSHLNIDLLRRNFHLETLLQKLGVDIKIIDGVESLEEQLNLRDDTSTSQQADSTSNPTMCLQTFHSKSEDAASRQQTAVLQKSSSLPSAALQMSSSKAAVLQKSASLPTDDQDKSFRAVADMLSANNYKNQLSFSQQQQSAAGYKLCNSCHQIIYPLEVYSNLQLENNQLKYQLIHLESNRLSLEFKLMILKQEVGKLKEVCKDKSRMEDHVISLLEETSSKGAKAALEGAHEGAKVTSFEDGEGVVDDCSRLDSNYDLPDDLTEIGDSCLIQTSSAEKTSFGAKTGSRDKNGAIKETADDRLLAQLAKLKIRVSKLKNSKSILKIRTRELLSEYRKKRDLLKQRDEQLSHVKLWLTKLHALHVRLQHTHSDILENVKEELKIIATLAVQSNPSQQIHPEQSQICPEQSQIHPEQSQIHSEQSQICPEQSLLAPEIREIDINKQDGRQSCDDVITADSKVISQSQKSIEIQSDQSASSNSSHDQQSDQLQNSITIEAQSNQSESSNKSHDISAYKIENLFGLIKTMLANQRNRSSFDSCKLLKAPSSKRQASTAADVTDAALLNVTADTDTFAMESLSLIYTPKPISIGRQ